MKKHILYFLTLILLTSLFNACGEDSKLAKEETLYINDENLVWLTSDSLNQSFLMKDDNGISSSFTKQGDNHEFSPSSGGYFFVTTHITNTESYTQSYSSSVGLQYMTILTAGFEPFGNVLSLNFGKINIRYDFKYKKISEFYSDYGIKSTIMTDKGYEDQDKIYSTVDFIDSLEINNHVITNIMHIKFYDFYENYTNYTPCELFLAPQIGLIKYACKNGLTYNRQF
jgi:hypothetical protein